MLTQFRSFAKTPVAKGLLGVLAASFIIWGIRDVFRNGAASDAVITAGPRTVNAVRFRQMFQEELKQYSQQSGQTISVQDAVSHNIDRQVADAIASDEALAAYIDRSGIHPSDKQIVAEIAKAPRFFNAVSGKFDRQAYEAFVQQIGMTDAQFEGLLRDDLAQTQFVSGVAAGLRAPLLFSALQAAYDGEGRSFSYFVLPATAVTAVRAPDRRPDERLHQAERRQDDAARSAGVHRGSRSPPRSWRRPRSPTRPWCRSASTSRRTACPRLISAPWWRSPCATPARAAWSRRA